MSHQDAVTADAEHLDPGAVRSMFDGIARFYDPLNTALSAGRDRAWRRLAADAAALRPGDTAVDVCTGTGMLARQLLARVGPGGHVLGLDFSEGMLEVARRQVAGVEFRWGDATELAGVEDGAADAVTMAFGLRNVPDRVAALRAAHRVLRPGGRLVVLEFGQVRGRLLGRFYRWYLTRLLPRVGRALNPRSGAYGYLPASIARYPDAQTVAAWCRQAGFSGVAWRRLTFGVVTLHVGTRAG